MRRKLLTVLTVFSMCCLVACGREKSNDANADNSQESNNQAEPTPDPYPGIDMNSELSGKEWLKTFDNVINEPKIVVYNDQTGRKQIIEPNDKVLINHESDILAIHMPDGYAMIGYGDLILKDSALGDSYKILYLDFDAMIKNKTWNPLLMISYKDEEFSIEFKIQTQE